MLLLSITFSYTGFHVSVSPQKSLGQLFVNTSSQDHHHNYHHHKYHDTRQLPAHPKISSSPSCLECSPHQLDFSSNSARAGRYTITFTVPHNADLSCSSCKCAMGWHGSSIFLRNRNFPCPAKSDTQMCTFHVFPHRSMCFQIMGMVTLLDFGNWRHSSLF